MATDQSPTRQVTPRSIFSNNARQWEAWCKSCEHRFLLYGGAAGGGKSFFLRWWAVFYLLALACAGVKRATVGLFCEDYPSLLDRQISKIRTEFPSSLGVLKEGTTRDFELQEKWGSGRILLRNLDDPAKYLSAEFAGIAVDELTLNEQGVFDFLRSRLRWPGVPRPCFVAGTNPSGIGHAWVKRLWIEQQFPRELLPLKDEFVFVPAKASDNPYLSEQYHADLQTLPPDMAKAYAEGSWDIFAGQYFDLWGTGGQFIDRPESWDIKHWWPKWISIDWGFEHPSAVYWHTRTDDSKTLTYREFVRNRLAPTDLASEIVALTKGDTGNSTHRQDETISDVYLSPDAFAKRTSEATIAEQIGDVFARAGLPRPIPADDDRVGGWMMMYQMLKAGDWRIGSNCQSLIRCMPTLIRDDVRVEDVAKMDGDDPADSVRYGLKSRHSPGRKPLDVRVLEKLEDRIGMRLKDVRPEHYTHVMMERTAILEQESKTDQPFRIISRRRR